MKNIITLISLLFCFVTQSQSFHENFKNESIRFDFLFSGNINQTTVQLIDAHKINAWNGRKVNLTENVLQGDAQINVFDTKTNTKIYTQSFSTLYQEWLTQQAAKTEVFDTEQVLYVPMPKHNFRVQVVFFKNNKPNTVFEQSFKINKFKKLPFKNSALSTKQLVYAKNTSSPINITLVAEGFTQAEEASFQKATERVVQALFAYPSFQKNKDSFNIYAAFTVSADSGVTIPSKNSFKNTVAQATFDTFGAARYLTTNKVFNLHDALAGTATDHIVIIANSDQYGGAGIFNAYTLVTLFDDTFNEVVVHELGHSFAGLGDEYFYANDIFSENAHQNEVEPWVKNNTTLVDFESKWKNKLPKNTVIPTPKTKNGSDPIGVYLGIEGGKVYIPHQDCRMHTNSAVDFCSVCSDAIEELILHYTVQK